MNPATSTVNPSTRCWARAWLEISIEQTSTRCSTITANRACRSGASGVVPVEGTASAPTRTSIVPTSPVCRPSRRSAPSSRKVVVVLPLVPVTPRVSRRSAGRP